jgi:hypothetical protein
MPHTKPALAYPDDDAVIATARMLRDELREEYDTDPTEVRERKRAERKRSGEHALDLAAIRAQR